MQLPGENRLALLGSLCLFLSLIEYLIPKPFPFMRIGLANLPLLIAVRIYGFKEFFLLALLKTLGQGIIGGTFFSYIFLFSFAGTFSSAMVMYVLQTLFGKKYIGFVGLGCAGAMVSNIAQLLLARYFIFGAALRYIMPPFLASGFVTGITLGFICDYFCRHSKWFAGTASYSAHDVEIPYALPEKTKQKGNFRLKRNRRWNDFFNSGILFFCGLVMALIFLFAGTLENRIVLFLFFLLLFWFSGKKLKLLITLTIMSLTVIFNLFVPYGRLLLVIGPLRITQGSLLAGIEKALVLGSLILLSRTFINSDLRLPGKIGFLLGESFRMLEILRQKKGYIHRGRITAGIDRVLSEVEAEASGIHEVQEKKKLNYKAIVVLCIIITAAAFLAFIPGFSQN